MARKKIPPPLPETLSRPEEVALTVRVQQVPRDHDRFILWNICFGSVFMTASLLFFLKETGLLSIATALFLSLSSMGVLVVLRGIWLRMRKMPVFSGVSRVTSDPAGLQVEGLGTTPWSSIQGFHETGDQNGLVIIQVEKQHDLFLSVPDPDQVDRLLNALAFYAKQTSIQTHNDEA